MGEKEDYLACFCQALGMYILRYFAISSAHKSQLHQWVGRAVALLAIAQVPLGLTLYGSPKVLFILYTLWMFTLLVAYFILSHRYQGGGGDDYSSNYTGGRTDVTGDGRSRRGHGFLKPLAAGGLAAAAFGALSRRKSDRRADSRTRTDHSRHSSRHGSGSFVEEKLSDGGHGGQHTWRNRLLAGAATAGVLGLAKNFFGGRKQQDSDSGSYSASNVHSASRTDISRAEEGLAPTTPPSNRIRRTDHIATVPVAAASPSRHSRMRPRKSGGSIDSYESQNFQSPGRDKRKNHTARNTIAALGVAGYLKHKFDQRGRAKEDRRVEELREQEIAEERLARRNSQNRRYTGDGRTRRDESFTESEMTPLGGSTPGLSRHTLPRPAGGHHSSINVVNTGDHSLARPPPIGGGIIHDSSGSEGYVSGGGRRPGRGGRRGAADLAAVEDGRRRRSSVGSPPISIKMKMRNDGGRQHVTLRRLNPQEAAAAAASRARGSRAGSIGSVGASGDERWRRTEARERAEAAEMGGSQEQQHNFMTGRPPGPPPPIHSSSSIMDLPPPPPMPASQSALGFGSPGSGVYDTGESAAGSKADSNRRRRRAERARAEAARDGRGTRVEFE